MKSSVFICLLAPVIGSLAAGAQKPLRDNADAPAVAVDSVTGNIATHDAGSQGHKPPEDEHMKKARKILKQLEQNPPTQTDFRKGISVGAWIKDLLPSFSLFPKDDQHSSAWGYQTPLSQVKKVISHLEQSAANNNPEALNILADFHFYGNYTWPRNFDVALDYYKQLADMGDSNGHFMTGLYYATGLGSNTAVDQARAHLYYSAAAVQGHIRAQMALGFRYHMGIGAPKNCEMAGTWYREVAGKAIDWVHSGPPGGQHWVPEAFHIAEEYGGVYGTGASVTSSGANAVKTNPHSDANANIDDVIEYLDLMSRKGDSKASLNLGRIYYEGQRGLQRDFDLARKYFLLVASNYWRKDGTIVEKPVAGVNKLAGKAATYLARIYLRGEGVEPNFSQAYKWVQRGTTNGEAQAFYLMGIMYRDGLGIAQDEKLANEKFRTAADRLEYPPAQVEVAKAFLERGTERDIKLALHYFEHAARSHNLEAYYYLGEMSYQGIGRDKACVLATHYFKRVAERVEPLVSTWSAANEASERSDVDTALVHYIVMAEQGWDAAQVNLAYLIDPVKGWFDIDLYQYIGSMKRRPSPPFRNAHLALVYWTRSSLQGNIDATVKVGDYHYYGVGTEANLDKAYQWYNLAAEHSASAQALWNLGYMYENGKGLAQDFHLAKRFYDLALDVSPEAYLPVTLCLLRLRLRSAWNTLTNGSAQSIQDDPSPGAHKNLGEWVKAFLDQPRYHEQYDEVHFQEQDGYHHAHGADEEDEYDDSILDSMLVFSIVLLISAIIYYRQQRQQRLERQREAGEGGQPGADDGMAQWGGAMVGH